MQQTDPISGTLQLRDIHLPTDVSWWPLAPGWWILLLLILIVIGLAYLALKINRSRAFYRQVSAEIENIENDFIRSGNKHRLVQSLSILMRRGCLSFYPRHETASLTGEDWLSFLDQTFPRDKVDPTPHYFQRGIGKILADAPYISESSPIEADPEQLIELCAAWITSQPVERANEVKS